MSKSALFVFLLLSLFCASFGETGDKTIAASSNIAHPAGQQPEKVFIGQDAGTEGASNTFYGTSAGESISTGVRNTFIGLGAGYAATTGNDNSFLGYGSGYHHTTGQFNVFLGSYAGFYNTAADFNTFLGYSSGYNNSDGENNSFLGYGAGHDNTTGKNNSFFGFQAGYINTTGIDNTFHGSSAGYSNLTGQYNTFLGKEAGFQNTSGSGNLFLGYSAGYTNTYGNRNIFIGYAAGGYNAGGSNKLFIENSDSPNPLIYGEFDNDIVNINGKLGIGTKTPGYPVEVLRTDSNASIVLNRTDGAKNYVNATASFGNFGTVNNYPLRLTVNSLARLTLNTNNSLSMANGASCTAGGVWTDASSIALKENISALNSDEAAATLQSLNPVKYNYKAEKEERHVGFIAEDVPELVAMKDRKSLSPMDIVAVLTKVTQDQQKTIEMLTRQMLSQQQVIQAQQQINEKTKIEIAELKKKRYK